MMGVNPTDETSRASSLKTRPTMNIGNHICIVSFISTFIIRKTTWYRLGYLSLK